MWEVDAARAFSKANALKGTAPVAKAVAAVNALLEAPMTQAEFNDPTYSFRVYVVPKVINNAKKADQAVIYSPVGSDVEVAIKLVERPKYRMTDATIYVFITLAAVIRVAAPLGLVGYRTGMEIAGGLWAFAFLLFLLAYGPILFRARLGQDAG